MLHLRRFCRYMLLVLRARRLNVVVYLGGVFFKILTIENLEQRFVCVALNEL